jgi:hypothetical protein
MLTWVASFFTGAFAGPARNAPNGGKNIKALIKENPPALTPSDKDIQHVKSVLKPTVVNAERPVVRKMPLLEEFDNVFDKGWKEFLTGARGRRATIKHVDPEDMGFTTI